MKEGHIFECLLDGTKYVVKDIVNKMVVLQSRKRDKQIIIGIDTLRPKSLYRKREEG